MKNHAFPWRVKVEEVRGGGGRPRLGEGDGGFCVRQRLSLVDGDRGSKTRLLIPQEVCKRHARLLPIPANIHRDAFTHTHTHTHTHTQGTHTHARPQTHTQAAQATAPRVLTRAESRRERGRRGRRGGMKEVLERKTWR
uniref:Uncharacterized protein n=1 Tax=Gasterosteus aculeatus TaxID=69293 RepID=G3NK85_GASAC